MVDVAGVSTGPSWSESVADDGSHAGSGDSIFSFLLGDGSAMSRARLTAISDEGLDEVILRGHGVV